MVYSSGKIRTLNETFSLGEDRLLIMQNNNEKDTWIRVRVTKFPGERAKEFVLILF